MQAPLFWLCADWLAAEDFLYLADFLLYCAADALACAFVLQVGVVGELSDLLFDGALHFVELALSFIVCAGGGFGCCHDQSPYSRPCMTPRDSVLIT